VKIGIEVCVNLCYCENFALTESELETDIIAERQNRVLIMRKVKMKVRKAVIPAAGLGTRFLPATKSLPKEMIPIVDKPAIQYIVEEIVGSGIQDILIITGRGKRAIEDHFDKSFELNEVLKRKRRSIGT